MKKCPICGRKVVSKRKDAIYCRNPRCRKKAFEARKEHAASATPSSSPNKASVVVTFPDGTKWLMELTPIQPNAQTTLPTLTQVASVVQPAIDDAVCRESDSIETRPAPSQNGSEQIPVAISDEAEAVGPSDSEAATEEAAADASAIKNGSETVPSIVADAPNKAALVADAVALSPDRSLHAPDSEQGAVPAPVEVPTAVVNVPSEPALRTVELYFVDARGAWLPYDVAVRIEGRRCRLASGAYARLGVTPSDGIGLSGRPGRWRDAYPHSSPSKYGFPSDIGVLFFDDERRRAYAPDVAVLALAFGPGWPERIRELVERCVADGADAG